MNEAETAEAHKACDRREAGAEDESGAGKDQRRSLRPLMALKPYLLDVEIKVGGKTLYRTPKL